jgi:uncharacterized membrane protein YgcG
MVGSSAFPGPSSSFPPSLCPSPFVSFASFVAADAAVASPVFAVSSYLSPNVRMGDRALTSGSAFVGGSGARGNGDGSGGDGDDGGGVGARVRLDEGETEKAGG